MLGLALLVRAGEALVRGASGIAPIARVAVVGLTIVAAGISMPELVVSTQAAREGGPVLAVGNIVGLNIFNIGAILGVVALVNPLSIQGNMVPLEWFVMMLAAFHPRLLSRNASVDRLVRWIPSWSGLAFMAHEVWVGHKTTAEMGQAEFAQMATASFGWMGQAALLFNLAAVAVRISLLAGGSSALIRGTVGVASGLGISDTVIGLTIVTANTGTPDSKPA